MKTLFMTIFLAMASLLTMAQTGEKNFIDQNYIEVTGRAEIEVVPDQIYLAITINQNDIKGKETIETVEKQITDKLKEIGIDVAKDLSIQDYSSNLRTYFIKKTEVVTLKNFQLLVHDAKTVVKVFRELDKLGISNISVSKLDHSKIIDYRKEVKVNAIKAAKEKAEALTTAINQTIGRAIYINENSSPDYTPLRGQYLNMSVQMSTEQPPAEEKAEPDIQFEKIKIEYTVFVRFELK